MMIEAKKSRECYLEGKAICSNIGERHKEWKQLWKMNLPSKIKKKLLASCLKFNSHS
jgi:hypothetical protein